MSVTKNQPSDQGPYARYCRERSRQYRLAAHRLGRDDDDEARQLRREIADLQGQVGDLRDELRAMQDELPDAIRYLTGGKNGTA